MSVAEIAKTQTIIDWRAMKPLASGSWVVEPLRGKGKGEKILTARAVIQGDSIQ